VAAVMVVAGPAGPSGTSRPVGASGPLEAAGVDRNRVIAAFGAAGLGGIGHRAIVPEKAICGYPHQQGGFLLRLTGKAAGPTLPTEELTLASLWGYAGYA